MESLEWLAFCMWRRQLRLSSVISRLVFLIELSAHNELAHVSERQKNKKLVI